MLKLEKITIKRNKKIVLSNVSINADAGNLITIVGANGSGKSTLFDTIAGCVKPEEGAVLINGKNVTSNDEATRSLMIGRLFQNPSLSCVPTLTVRENLAIAQYKLKRVSFGNGLRNFSDEMLKEFNGTVANLLDKKMQELSGGQRQFISLLMVLSTKPKLLLLDEPTAALDPQAATNLLVFVAKYVRTHAITTLLITHDPNIALTLGDGIWIVKDGTVLMCGQEEKSGNMLASATSGINYDELKKLRV